MLIIGKGSDAAYPFNENASAGLVAKGRRCEYSDKEHLSMNVHQSFLSDNDADDLRQQIRRSWRQFGEPDKRGKGIVCPFCGNGKGRDGDGLREVPESDGLLKCFKCGRSFDAITLIEQTHNCGFMDALRIGADTLGLCMPESRPRRSTPFQDFRPQADQSPQLEEPPEPIPDFTDTLAKFPRASAHPDAIAYLERRGLSAVIADRLGLLYDPQKREMIAPYWHAAGYTHKPIDGGKGISAKGSKVRPFNADAFDSKRPVFVTEGFEDCSSLEALGCAAIAVNGATNLNGLVVCLKARIADGLPVPSLIAALDNDDTGKKQSQKLMQLCRELGVHCYDPGNLYGSHKDANEALCKDAPSLAVAVSAAERAAKLSADSQPDLSLNVPPEPDDNAQSRSHPNVFPVLINARDYILSGDFDAEIERYKPFASRFTGFSNIDERGPFLPGLYAIGAISSLGKTTFALQMAYQLAAGGHDVLYFTLEQSVQELTAKHIVRICAQQCKYRTELVTAAELRLGNTSEGIRAARSTYIDTVGDRLQLSSCTFGTNAAGIQRVSEDYAQVTGKPPIVFVDYLQALSPINESASVRDNIDAAIRLLKRWQSDSMATVILISSVNRTNYQNAIDFESLKESGMIEYSCDVIWGLDLSCVRDPFFSRSDKSAGKKREIVKAAKAEQPREIVMSTLKNRFGQTGYDCNFYFYPCEDRFEPCKRFAPNPGGWRALIPRSSDSSDSDTVRPAISAEHEQALNSIKQGWTPY